MAECKHVFIGCCDGVHCTRCGLHLTGQQYHELLYPPEDEQNASSDADNKEPAEPKKTAQTATEPPQAKPKRARKKKEAANE